MVADKKPALILSCRLNLALLCFIGCLITYALRTNISIALICMIKPIDNVAVENKTMNSECPSDEIFKANTSSTLKGEFVWSEDIKGQILSAFFYGYMCSQILGGYVASNYGAKRVILYTILGASLLTLSNPVLARVNEYFLIGARILIGFLQGATFPAMHTMWASWGPPDERSLLTGVSYAGAQIGNMLVLFASGKLCESGIDGGWPLIFYTFGLAGVFWCVLWILFTSDKPSSHPRISTEERHYIESTLEETMGKSTDKPPPTPWLEIFTSPAVWAIWCGHFAGDWGAYTMMMSTPKFLKNVLGLDMRSLGLLSAVPYLAYFLMINVGGFITDIIRQKKILNTANTRRLAMLVALIGQAIFLILASYCGCGQKILVIVFVTIAMAISGLQYAGFVVNYLDIAPPFSGTIMGIGNTISCLSGIISGSLTEKITKDGTKAQWQLVMWISGIVLTTGAIIFAIFAKGDVQKWAKTSNEALPEEQVPLQKSQTENAE